MHRRILYENACVMMKACNPGYHWKNLYASKKYHDPKPEIYYKRRRLNNLECRVLEYSRISNERLVYETMNQGRSNGTEVRAKKSFAPKTTLQ